MATITALKPRPYLLHNQVQHYAWGTKGEHAFIPHLLGIKAEPKQPYAELWIGIHPKAPSKVVLDEEMIPLQQWIATYPQETLGNAVAERFSGKLPFLLKVLSAGEPLSIQAHPNKAQAEELHIRDPEHYPDDNHKPELAIALDSLTALMGFKPFPDILKALHCYPELGNFVGQELCDTLNRVKNPSSLKQQELVRLMFSTLVRRSIRYEQELSQSLDELARRLGHAANPLKEEEDIFLTLRERYSGADVGLCALFLFNLIHLKSGQGVFTKAGVPHAYLEGNIVECMANSDNVVRVGLTPKYKDAETLITILDYEPGPISLLEGSLDGEEIVYHTPVSEFQVSRWNMNPHTERRERTKGVPTILLLTKGEIRISWNVASENETKVFRQGQAFFIPACLTEFQVQAKESVEIFKVGVPPRFNLNPKP